jgi:hypothetical protein
MFVLYGNWSGGGVDREGEGPKRVIRLTEEKCDYRSEFKAISKSYSQFENAEAWKKGTVLAQIDRLNEYLEDSLSKGWRY